MPKKISFKLSEKEIEKAIKELQAYKGDLQKKINELVNALVDYGVEVAKVEVKALGAFDTGELEGSIEGFFSTSLGVGIIRAGAPHAVFVEFGTGVKGKAEQHPEAGIQGWKYDVNDHGEEGWVYNKNGHFFRTKGMPSRPFMFNTLKKLEEELPRIAKEVFGK